MITYDLFSYSNSGRTSCSEFDIPDAEVFLYPSLLSYHEADKLFDTLKKNIIWEKQKIKLYGEFHDVPRLTAWYGDPNKSYIYSGIKLKTKPWNTALLKIREKIEKISKTKFNSVLLNLYRSGADSVSWHSDLKQKILLQHGSFLLMSGITQHNCLHQIPKRKNLKGERINLTFRVIKH